MNKSNDELEKQINSQKKEISLLKTKVQSIENFIKNNYNQVGEEIIEETKAKLENPKEIKQEIKSNPIDFTTVLTSIGIIGLVIGLISFFVYAVSNGWISKLMQIIIGVILGLGIMTLGLKWYENKPNWSTTLIGGGIFIVLLSLIIGVKQYEVLSKIIGLVMAVGVILYTLYISVKLNARIISYFGLVGGFFIPILSGFSSPVFTYTYLLIFLLGVLSLSLVKNWSEIRYISFFFMIIYSSIFFDSFSSMYPNGLGPGLSLFFLILTSLIFHISCFVYSLKEKVSMKELDIILLNSNSVVFAVTLGILLAGFLSRMELGLVYLILGVLFIVEYLMIKSSKYTNTLLNNSLLSSTIIFANIGIATAFNYSSDYLLYAIFVSQWIMYMYLSKVSQNMLFKVYGYLSFFILMMWYIYDLRFDLGIIHGSIFILALLVLPIISYLLSKRDIEKGFHQFFAISFMFFWIFSFTKYLGLFNINETVIGLILSLLWLSYSLVLVIRTHNDSKFSGVIENLTKVALAFVLIKIAFYDIIQLSGIIRIIGFMLFGGFLVLGGFLLKKK